MPCENCQVQFTVFKRKRSCADCKRYYCSNCLSARRVAPIALCTRCAIFAKRPLLRADLQVLKPKDLIFYLQSRHISTKGCVEKDELVGLVLNHAQNADTANTPHTHSGRSPNSHSSEADPTNSFDSLKQTCQSFFSNFAENIGESFSSFDGKGQRQQPAETANNDQTHIIDQPRVSTREIPTYASFQGGRFTLPQTQTQQNTNTTPTSNRSQSHSNDNETASSSPASLSSSSSPPAETTIALTADNGEPFCLTTSPQTLAAEQSKHEDCECSDDELMATFNERLAAKGEIQAQNVHQPNQVVAGTSVTLSSKVDNNNACDADADSSQSSFEELGAIGGISDDSKAATDTNSSNMEQWQILDNQRVEIAVDKAEDNEIITVALPVAIMHSQQQQPPIPLRSKKVTRRRSDGYLNRRRPLSDDDSPTGNRFYLEQGTLHELAEGESEVQAETTISSQDRRTNCKHCGKNKSNIRRRVEKMRQHLESSQMSEVDIKRELKNFLAFLEQRTKSVDCSDSETAVSSPLNARLGVDPMVNENDGIHVYGAAAASSSYSCIDSRFINLEDFDSLDELECLSVKQLKEVLMLNRVDYKGCCEKKELLDRVERLWKNLKTAPAVDKLQTDELCKICMDAPIECVILECGHMATCTNCGKVLSECPICRQYIVRVVRFFRA